jgi:D-aminoacyl-tRNA deacylase
MRALIQRISRAEVHVDGQEVGAIGLGLLVFLGIEHDDTEEDLQWLVQKVAKIRIFGDDQGHMNLSIDECGGQIMVISQFTLFASTKKGNRPSFIRSARPEQAEPLYQDFVSKLEQTINQKVETGIFGADMKVSLINDGPVTIWIDSKDKE